MVKLNKSKVKFDKDFHIYTLEGELLSGITSLLRRHIFADKYSGIDDRYLEQAKMYGSMIHEMIESCDKKDNTNENPVYKEYQSMLSALGLKPLENEYLISDNHHFASSIDVVLDDFSLADIKTTSTFDKHYLSWQLSIYAYLFELQNPNIKVNNLYGIWLPKDMTKAKIEEVERIPSEEVIKLFTCDINGEIYNEPSDLEISINSAMVDKNVIAQVIKLEQAIKAISNQRDELKRGLLEVMKENNVYSFKGEGLQLIRKRESQGVTFDTKKFKEENPIEYANYLKTRTISESLTIKLI